MPSRAIRVYADTSVFGGAFDEEFGGPSQVFFSQVAQGRFLLVTSVLVQAEIAGAPSEVQGFFETALGRAELVPVTDEALDLELAYLSANVVNERSAADARHVALATVTACPIIVSWNFRHIVSFRRIPLYNGVNVARGYHPLAIYSPLELIENEEDL
jgi:hypothetical protein